MRTNFNFFYLQKPYFYEQKKIRGGIFVKIRLKKSNEHPIYLTSAILMMVCGKQVVRAMEGDVSLDDLNEGVKPGQSTVFSSDGSSSNEYDVHSYNADMKKFRRMALSSQDYESSNEYGFTSDYGQNEGSSTASADSIEMSRHRAAAAAASARRI